MAIDANLEIGPDISGQLADTTARLWAAKTIRPPNQAIPGYALPHPELLDSFIARLERATPSVIVYEATSIQNAIPLPDFGSETPSQEHLAIYEQIADLRSSLQALGDKAIVAGYRPVRALMVPRSEVSQQIDELKSIVEALALEIKKGNRAGFGGMTVNLGPVGVDLRSIDAALSRLLRQSRGERDEIDAAALWETSEELAKISLAFYAQYTTASWQLSDKAIALVHRMRAAISQISAVAREILATAIAWHAKASGKDRGDPPRGGVKLHKVPRFDLAIDLGTWTTRIFVRDRGLVLTEPSIGAMRKTAKGWVFHAAGAEVIPMIGNVFRLAKVTPFSGISASTNDPLSLRL